LTIKQQEEQNIDKEEETILRSLGIKIKEKTLSEGDG